MKNENGARRAGTKPAATLWLVLLLAAMLSGCGHGGDLDTPNEMLPEPAAPTSGLPAESGAESLSIGYGGATQAAPGEYGGTKADSQPSAGPSVSIGGNTQDAVPELDMSDGTESGTESDTNPVQPSGPASVYVHDIDGVPDDDYLIGMKALSIDNYDTEPCIEIHGGEPYFAAPDHPYDAFIFSSLDDYDRPGPVYACISAASLPQREHAAHVKWDERPAGWNGTMYPRLVSGGYLWHKQPIVPGSLYDGKVEKKHLITLTEYLCHGSLASIMADIREHVVEHGGYVSLRVTPVYAGTHLICDGILIEALSVQDDGEDPLSICTFCYNVQPGIEIDYRNGLARAGDYEWSGEDAYGNHDYILDERYYIFHEGPCAAVASMLQSYRYEYRGQRDDLIDNKYQPCKVCGP